MAVAVICLTVTKVQTDIPLFLLLSATIFFTAIGCEWFYQGIEDFKYVAIRGMVVKDHLRYITVSAGKVKRGYFMVWSLFCFRRTGRKYF